MKAPRKSRSGCGGGWPPRLAARPDAGASLVEALVAFGLTVAVAAAAFFLFTLHQRLARAQIEGASLEQGQRAVHRELRRALRAAGRGGLARQLPGQPPRPELAVDVQKRVGAGHAVGSRTAAEGTDVLIVRGVLDGPLYWVDEYRFDPATNRGQVRVRARTATGWIQPLDMLRDAGAAGDDALLLVSADAPGVHAVVPIADVTARGRGRSRSLLVAFHADASRGAIAAGYLALSSGGSWPAGYMDRVARVGVLVEWRFYVRPPDPNSLRGAQLAKARLYPGTDIAWRRRSAHLTRIVADDITGFEADIRPTGDGTGWSVTVVSTAQAGAPAAAALRVPRVATTVARTRNLR